MDADDPGSEERGRIQDAPIDVRLRGEVDDGIGVVHERVHHVRIGDVALDESQPSRLFWIGFDGGKVGPVARVRQLVENRDPGAVPPRQHVPHEARADEPCTAGNEELRARTDRAFLRRAAHPTGRSIGGSRRPA